MFGYDFAMVSAMPDFQPSRTDAPSWAKQIRRSVRTSPVKPCRSKHVNSAVAIEELSVLLSSTTSRKNFVGTSMTTVFRQTAIADLVDVDVDSSIITDSLESDFRICHTSFFLMLSPTNSQTSAAVTLLCNITPMSRPFACCKSTSEGRSEKGRSRLIVCLSARQLPND